jgi:hypothetical protein
VSGPTGEMQRAVMELYRAFGVTVIRFNEGRRTRIQSGWPDLACFHTGKGMMWLHEVKARGEAQSVEQSTVQALCASCRVTYVLGGPNEARAQIEKLGLVATL